MKATTVAHLKNKKDDCFKKVVTSNEIYKKLPSVDTLEFDPNYKLEENEWFSVTDFSEKSYFLDLLKENLKPDSVNFKKILKNDINEIDYIAIFENKKWYFQRVNFRIFQVKGFLHIGDELKYIENGMSIPINADPDAIYDTETDILIFQKLTSITGIFKGIDVIYREATELETSEFLKSDFIILVDGFNGLKVKSANRKRIALVMDIISKFDVNQKRIVFSSIREYYPALIANDNSFKIANENDLKLLLYGFQQRFYTTPDGREKRLANSVKVI